MKNKLALFLALTTLSIVTFAQTKEETATIQYENQWEIQIKLDMPELKPEAIQIAWLEFDPSEKFIKNFNFEILAENLKNAKDENEKTSYINSRQKSTWDKMFNVVKGDEIYLLTNNDLFLSSVSNCAQPKIKRWMVSKTFTIDDKYYCFAIPIDLENGTKLVVTMNKTNLISLTDLYNKLQK